MGESISSAAASLLGISLASGWKVIRQIAPGKNSTGGTFSHAYEVKNGDQLGFLKAFDFIEAFDPGKDTIELLKLLTSAYEHERDLLNLCDKHQMSKIVRAIESGHTDVPGFDRISGRVY